ncbi:MAG: hypothetical protein ACOCP8_08895 [archaeon]
MDITKKEMSKKSTDELINIMQENHRKAETILLETENEEKVEEYREKVGKIKKYLIEERDENREKLNSLIGI